MPDIETIADRLLADEPALLSSLDFGAFVAQGAGSGPSVLIGDASEISLMQTAWASHLDHRMAHLAKPGDMVLVRENDACFARYLKDYRGIEDVAFVNAGPSRNDSVAKLMLNSQARLRDFVDLACQNGGLTFKPYITTGTIWHLAQAIGERAGLVINVSGPSPRISQRANDKLWFTHLARTVIGGDAVPPTMSAYGPKAAAALIFRLSSQGQQVIVKVPDSAGSKGNVRLDQTVLEGLTVDQIEALLLDRLHGTGWSDSYPILVGVWDENVTCTPSVQMWIPHVAEGKPSAQGVFEQRVFGASAAFIGAVKSELPQPLQDTLVAQTLAVAEVLQRLGYYGRCSFDAVICDGNTAEPSIHWIECNGRWSGVSIPLATLNSISTGQIPDGLVIIQEKLPGNPINTSQAVTALESVLYCGGLADNGVILMSPPTGAEASTINLLVFARHQSDAIRLGDRAMALLKNVTADQVLASE